jgi:hypothetical protein
LVDWLTPNFFHSHTIVALQKSETEETSEKKAGAVSKRRRLIASGAPDVLDITSAASSNPQFIEMHNLERSITTVSKVEEGEGIEIEGPIRPSSYYAMT